jgi:hypothetical protein
MCAKTSFALFNNDRVFHNKILFQTSLFENGVKGADGHVNVWLPGNRHGAKFGRVFELAMTSFRPS